MQTNFLDIQNSYELTNINQYKKSIIVYYYNFRSPEKALREFVTCILTHICKLAQLYNIHVSYVLNVFRFDDSGTYCCRLHNGKGDTQVHFSRDSVVVVKSRSLKKAGYEEGTRLTTVLYVWGFSILFFINFKIITLYNPRK